MKHNKNIKNILFFIGKKTYIRFTTHNDLVFPKRLQKANQNTTKTRQKHKNDITIGAIIFRFSMGHRIVLYRNWWVRNRYVTKTKTNYFLDLGFGFKHILFTTKWI